MIRIGIMVKPSLGHTELNAQSNRMTIWSLRLFTRRESRRSQHLAQEEVAISMSECRRLER